MKDPKKRKRSITTTTKHQKSSSNKVTFKLGNGTGAILTSFPSGPPAPGTLLGKDAGTSERAQWRLYGNGKQNSKEEMLVGTTKRMQWSVGSNTGLAGHGVAAAQKRRKKVTSEDSEEKEDEGSCYLIGLYNSEKKQVTFHYAGERIHPFKQTLRQSRSHDEPKERAFSDFTYREQREELTMGFGSQGSKAGLRRMKKNILTDDNVGSKNYLMSQVKQSPASKKMKSSSTSNSSSSSSSSSSSTSGIRSSSTNASAEEDHKRTMLPAFNKDTMESEEIFPFASILPPTQLLSLRNMVKSYDRSISKENAEMEEVWSPRCGYVRYLTTNLIEKYELKKERRKQITKLVFLDYLCRFHRIHGTIRTDSDHPNITSLSEKYDIPDVLFTYFLQTFTNEITLVDPSTKITTTMYKKNDKLNKSILLWILIMSLHVENFHIKTIYPLAHELRLSTKDLIVSFRYFGCTYTAQPKRKDSTNKGEGTDYKVKLQAPLTFPKPKYQGRGGR